MTLGNRFCIKAKPAGSRIWDKFRLIRLIRIFCFGNVVLNLVKSFSWDGHLQPHNRVPNPTLITCAGSLKIGCWKLCAKVVTTAKARLLCFHVAIKFSFNLQLGTDRQKGHVILIIVIAWKIDSS
ncbi:hypothetical protein T10_9704 [Trichinella papuae]|uniref:Uncharacterized protein n=1 Tax=Trichinella papuae TaxID=268474 RepID=A0A0V1MVI3_9BILA|nr:hypothetical protein T10_9704 [Trichinella papuae]